MNSTNPTTPAAHQQQQLNRCRISVLQDGQRITYTALQNGVDALLTAMRLYPNAQRISNCPRRAS